MGLETGTYINDLVTTNPDGADQASTSDDHQRLIKSVLKNTLPNANGAINPTPTELNYLVGITETPAGKTNIQNSSYTYAVDSSITANQVVIALTPAPAAYAGGQRFYVKVANTNTGASTLKVGALAATAIQKQDGTALDPNQLLADGVYGFVYDGTAFKIISGGRSVIKSDVKDWGTVAVNTTIQLDEADLHLVAAGANLQLTMSSTKSNDKATVAIKNNGSYTVTLAGIDVDSPTLTVGTNIQDVLGLVKSHGQTILVGAVYNKATV